MNASAVFSLFCVLLISSNSIFFHRSFHIIHALTSFSAMRANFFHFFGCLRGFIVFDFFPHFIFFVNRWWQRHDWDNCNGCLFTSNYYLFRLKPIHAFLDVWTHFDCYICNHLVDLQIISCSTSPDLHSIS